MAFHSERQVLVNGELVDDVELLEERGDAARPGIVGVARPKGAPSTLHGSARRLQRAGQHLHQRRLSGAVLADKAMDGAALDREADVVDRPHAGIILGESIDGKDGRWLLARHGGPSPGKAARPR